MYILSVECSQIIQYVDGNKKKYLCITHKVQSYLHYAFLL